MSDNLLKRCDCVEARWPKCAHGWHLAMRHDGKRFAVSLDTHLKKYEPARPRPETRGEAAVLAGEIELAIRKGAYPPARPRATVVQASASEGLTFAAAAARYHEAVVEPSEIDRQTVKQIQTRLGRYSALDIPDVGIIGEMPLASLTSEIVEACYRRICKTVAKANSTKHKYGQALRNLLDWAVAKKHLAVSPMTTETDLPAGPDAMRKRRVHPDEETNLLQAASEGQTESGRRLVALLTLAIDLGGRQGELLALRWADILWTEGPLGRVYFAAVERGARKSGEGKSRKVPMTARVRAVLQALRVSPTGKDWASTDYVLHDGTGGRVKNTRKAWVTTVLRAHNHEPRWVKRGANTLATVSRDVFNGLDLHFHDLRHECALRWLEKGYTLGTIATLLGHADLSTLRVYLGLAERDALREAEALDVTPDAGVPVTLPGHDGQLLSVQTTAKRQQNGKRQSLRVVARSA